MIFRGLNAKVP